MLDTRTQYSTFTKNTGFSHFGFSDFIPQESDFGFWMFSTESDCGFLDFGFRIVGFSDFGLRILDFRIVGFRIEALEASVLSTRAYSINSWSLIHARVHTSRAIDCRNTPCQHCDFLGYLQAICFHANKTSDAPETPALEVTQYDRYCG